MNYYDGAQPGAVERAIEVMFGSKERRDLEQLGTAQALADREAALADAAEMLLVVLANVSGGDWTLQTPEWQEAAARWRDNYFAVKAAK